MENDRFKYALVRSYVYVRGIMVCAIICAICFLLWMASPGTKMADTCLTVFLLNGLLAFVYAILFCLSFCSKMNSGYTPDVERFEEEERREMHKENSWIGY